MFEENFKIEWKENFNETLKDLNVQNKNSILNELNNIIGDEDISSLTSSLNKLDIKYKTKI